MRDYLSKPWRSQLSLSQLGFLSYSSVCNRKTITKGNFSSVCPSQLKLRQTRMFRRRQQSDKITFYYKRQWLQRLCFLYSPWRVVLCQHSLSTLPCLTWEPVSVQSQPGVSQIALASCSAAWGLWWDWNLIPKVTSTQTLILCNRRSRYMLAKTGRIHTIRSRRSGPPGEATEGTALRITEPIFINGEKSVWKGQSNTENVDEYKVYRKVK